MWTYASRFLFFFFSSRRRHTRCSRDWSSDVCSSDLALLELPAVLRIGDRWVDLHAGHTALGRDPELHAVGMTGHRAGNLAQGRHIRPPWRGGKNLTRFVPPSRPPAGPRRRAAAPAPPPRPPAPLPTP